MARESISGTKLVVVCKIISIFVKVFQYLFCCLKVIMAGKHDGSPCGGAQKNTHRTV